MTELAVVPKAEMIPVHARPHPFSMDTVYAEFPLGLTIAEILGSEAKACRVDIGGMTIPPEWWTHIRPKAGHSIVITRYPQGGNTKSILRIVAFAALAVGVALLSGGAGAILANFLPGTFASGTLSAGLLAAGVGLVGALVINALIPPQTPNVNTSASASTDLLNSITGTSNQTNPYGAIPCAVGFVLYYPTYAALPYTELSGDDQYIRCLFDLGYGDPDPSDMKIGDTDLANYTDVETEIGTNPGLFSQDVTEVAAGDALNTDGDTATRTSATDADELSIDLAYASGLFGVDSSGNNVSVTNNVIVEFAPTGTGTWTSLDSTTSGLTVSTPAATVTGGVVRVTNGERKAIRVGLRWKVTHGQYDVRVTRYSTQWGTSDPSTEVGDLTWSVIRSIRYSTVSTTGTKKLAMRIKATDQLSGSIQQFNCILSQPIPVWHPDTSAWVTEFSDNPAFVFRWLLRDCPANPRRIDASRIDDDGLIAWAAECDTKEFTYSNTLSQATTLYQLIKDVAAAGRASFNISNGKYGVIRDELQDTPVQVFTPRNSWGFGGNRAFPDAVQALRVQFINEEANFQQDERIVYDDGYGDADMVAADPSLTLATEFEQMLIAGCTNANGAWRLGRYHLAVGRLRPNTYFWNADVENLVCNRGDLVMFANDVIGVGLSQGRITRTIETDPTDPDNPFISAIMLDEKVTGVEGTSYAVRIRRQDGTTGLVQATPGVYGEETQLINLTTALENINPGDLVLWGEAGKDSIPLVITKIEPAADFAAKITAVDAAYTVLDADSGTPPTWISQITGQPWLDAPDPPQLLIVDSDQWQAPANDAGNTSPTMNVTVAGLWTGQDLDHLEVRYRRADTVGAWSTINLPFGQTTLQIEAIQRGLSYQIEARAVGKNGAASIWVQETHTVASTTENPIAPSGLVALSVADGVHLTWTTFGTQRADVEYEVERTGDISGSPDPASWINIANVKASAYTDGITDGVVRWYRVKAVDFQGLQSAYSSDVSSQNKSVQDGADKTSEQPIVYAGIGANLIGNGNFSLGNIKGWASVIGGSGGVFNAGGIGIAAGSGVQSPTFSVTPGQKYRLSFTGTPSSGSGQSTYHRIFYDAAYSPNTQTSSSTLFFDFLANGTLAAGYNTYTYDWVCPPGIHYASLAMYNLSTSGVFLSYNNVAALDYGASSEWGADITSTNQSASTATISNFTVDDLPDGTSRYAAVELGADNTMSHVIFGVEKQLLGNVPIATANAIIPDLPKIYTVATFNVTANSVSDVFNVQAVLQWASNGTSTPFGGPTVYSTLDGYIDAPAFVGTSPNYGVPQPTPGTYVNFGFGPSPDVPAASASIATFFGSITGLASGNHTISIVFNNWSQSQVVNLIYLYGVCQQISS